VWSLALYINKQNVDQTYVAMFQSNLQLKAVKIAHFALAKNAQWPIFGWL